MPYDLKKTDEIYQQIIESPFHSYYEKYCVVCDNDACKDILPDKSNYDNHSKGIIVECSNMRIIYKELCDLND